MAVESIGTLMGNLKKAYDKSKNKSRWCVLHGLNKEYSDTFIAGDNDLWQIKSEEVGQGEFVAAGTRVSRFDSDLEKIMGNGSPVPFGTVTPVSTRISVIMAGMQIYSSDSSNLLCREHLSSKQAALEQKLKDQLNEMMDNPSFRKKYREHKERLGAAYI